MADPLALALIGLGVGGALGHTAPKAPNISIPQPAPPIQAPTGSASTYKANQPSFLSAAAATPQQGQTASKTLLGQ